MFNLFLSFYLVLFHYCLLCCINGTMACVCMPVCGHECVGTHKYLTLLEIMQGLTSIKCRSGSVYVYVCASMLQEALCAMEQ